MKVTMIQDFFVSLDGVKTELFHRGDVVMFSDERRFVADGLVRDKIAVFGDVNERKLPEPVKDETAVNLMDVGMEKAETPKKEYATLSDAKKKEYKPFSE